MVTVSISDVATMAGVSRTTVSHVFSGNRPVSKPVQERVREATRRLGYVPSRAARSLALGASNMLGLLVPDIGNGFFAELAKGIEETAIERGYNLVLGNTGFDRRREVRYLEMLRSRAVDGVIYAAGAPPKGSQLLDILSGLPIVVVDEELSDVTAVTVVSDNKHGGKLAAEHLHALRHTGALVLAAGPGLLSSSERVEGFRRVWKSQFHLRFGVASGGFTEAGGYAAVLENLAAFQEGRFTAVFATNDLMAVGAIAALRQRGLDVPTDVSVVGFDDVAAARYCLPPLTTVRQDVWGMGSTAARALLDLLGSDDAPDATRHILPVKLVVRASSASPRREGGHVSD